MKKRLTSILHHAVERGVALILTLAIITLVTLLLIAFVVSMRVENTASKSFNDIIKAREIAQGAVDQAVATIRQATTKGGPMPGGVAGTILNYVTFPGAIYDYSSALVTANIPLYSVNAGGAVFPNITTNLNGDMWITSTNGEFQVANTATISAGWVYVAQNPSLALGPNNPIIGRYAFWVDDEASKINLNTAGTPPVTTPPSPDYGNSVSNEVDLGQLLPTPYSFVGAIQTRQTPPLPGFTTIEEIKLADPSDSDFTANRFSLTAYSNDANYPTYTDDLDVLDRQRLVLANLHDTTVSDSDILGTAGNSVSNAYIRLSDPALQNVYSSIATPNAFKDKYTDAGLKQFIANVIAYQHNPQNAADPQWFPPDGGGNPPTYLGLAKTPYINEVLISYTVTPANPPTTLVATVARTVSVELFYMYDGTYTPGAEQVIVSGLSPLGGASLPTTVIITPPAAPPTYVGQTASAYRRCDGPTDTGSLSGPPAADVSATVNYYRSSKRLDYAAMNFSPQAISDTSATTTYQGSQLIGDPAVNEQSGQWQAYKKITDGTLGAANKNTVTLAVYPYGLDTSKVVIASAPMQSIGELGYIHHPTLAWTHLTLQPGGGNTAANQIPDWAMLDLFTTVTPQTSGRININSFINPGLATVAPSTRRQVPLLALLNSLNSVIAPTTVAQQIYDDGNASRSDIYGMKDPNTTEPVFDTIGEVCELPLLASGANAAAKEAVIRRIGNLITVRSNTFTIWVLAQSIKQPNVPTRIQPIGTFDSTVDLITGDVRAQSVVERYENPPGSTPHFRTRYFRYLYN